MTNKIDKGKSGAPIGLVIFSGLSFIPAIGVFFGLVSIMISFFNFRKLKILFILGLSGIIFTVVVYSTLHYFGVDKRGGIYDEVRVTMDKSLLKNIRNWMEIYKVRYGNYPQNLSEILKINNDLTIKDPIVSVIKNYHGDSLFYYQLTPDSFSLFSIGFDGKPFTSDDIYPEKRDSIVVIH